MHKGLSGKTELGSIINLARGNRSLREYAADAGVSYTAIYMMENGEYTPSPKMIEKLTSKKANPQNGITYEDVMNAAGYKTDQDETKVNEKALEMAEKIVEEADKEDATEIEVEHSFDERRALAERLTERAKGLIFLALASIGMRFGNIPDERISLFKRRELLLSVEKGRITTWRLVFICVPDGLRYSRVNADINLNRFFRDTNTEGKKYSLVTNDPVTFSYLKRYEHAMAFRGELSVILIDAEANEILKEVYLSNYYLNDYSDEFYLT